MIYSFSPSDTSTQVDEQRKKYRKGTLRDDYLRRLNQIDFTWNAWESLWNLRYSQLIMFKREFGHCRVPQKYEKNPQLGESKEGLIRDFVYLMNLINFFRFRLSGEWVMEVSTIYCFVSFSSVQADLIFFKSVLPIDIIFGNSNEVDSEEGGWSKNGWPN